MKIFPAKIGRWAAELLLVFVGVYAAFSLNNFQQHGVITSIFWSERVILL